MYILIERERAPRCREMVAVKLDAPCCFVFGFEDCGVGLRIWNLWFGACGLGLRVEGLGFRV